MLLFDLNFSLIFSVTVSAAAFSHLSAQSSALESNSSFVVSTLGQWSTYDGVATVVSVKNFASSSSPAKGRLETAG